MILKKCPNCKMENPDKAEFCTECGTRLEAEEEAPVSRSEPVQTPAALSPKSSTATELPETPPQISPETSGPTETAAEPQQTPLAAPPGDFPIEEPVPQHPFGERFKVIAELGTGSLGTVYKVFDKAMEREMALRSIKAEIVQNSSFIEGFSQELKVERSIVHKNVGRIFELHLGAGGPFITMEYVSGRDLKELIKQKPRIPKERAVSIARQVCEGLLESHRLRVIHGDLNPGNIMIDKGGTAKIMDLGTARLLRSKIPAGAGIMLGDPDYLSPEQVRGGPPDERSDIYSLGVILYEMTTGSLPFTAETPEGVGLKHLNEIPRSPHEINPRISMQLSLMILRCLEKDRGKRYQTAKELRAELEKIEAGPRPGEQPAPTPAPTKPTPRKMEERVISKPDGPKKKTALLEKLDLKKLALPVAAAAAVVILTAVLWRLVIQPSKGAKSPTLAPQKLSVAVLPFKDLSPVQSDEYLGDAMAETLIEALATIPELYIPAKTSSFSFRAGRVDSSGIGQKLGVGHVLEADFQKTGNNLQLMVRLIKAEDGSAVWSQEYDRGVDDIFAIQEEIAQNIAKCLRLKLPQEKETSFLKNYALKADAYDPYAQGRFLLDKGGRENLEKAIAYFQKAIEKAPQHPAAYWGLAEAHIGLGNTFDWPRDKAFPAAKDAAWKALQLSPNFARAHIALALIKQNYDWDFAEAEKEYKEAIRIEPRNARAHHFYAELLSPLGRHDEALAEIKTAQSLDPLSPEINAGVGTVLYFTRIYDQAVQELRKALRIAPQFYKNYEYLGLVYIQMTQYEDAIGSFRKAAELGGDALEINLRVAFVHALQGRRREVGLRLTEALKASKERPVSYVSIGAVYAGLNEKEQALFCLAKAFQERDRNLLLVKVSPLFDSVRADARFTRLLQDIGLVK